MKFLQVALATLYRLLYILTGNFVFSDFLQGIVNSLGYHYFMLLFTTLTATAMAADSVKGFCYNLDFYLIFFSFSLVHNHVSFKLCH